MEPKVRYCANAAVPCVEPDESIPHFQILF
jgi:hypothetical protein